MKTQQRVEFGDFQTPPRLALEACALLKRLELSPSSVLEPTCGVGSFLAASEDTFQDCDLFRGYDINPDYVQTAQEAARKSEVFRKDFFQADWQEIIRPLSDPILILGNPPWVTNSGVGAIGGTNLLSKSNFQGLNGFDAITGKSNFDISEWMLIQLLVLRQTKKEVSAHPQAPRCKARPAGNTWPQKPRVVTEPSAKRREGHPRKKSMGVCGRALRVAAGSLRAALRRLEIRRGIPCATRLARKLPAATDTSFLV